MNVVRVVESLGGAARARDLLKAGASRHALCKAVVAGDLVRRDGTYALPGASRAAVLSASFQAEPTCITALESWGVPLIPAPTGGVHLAVARNRGITKSDPRLRRGVVIHRTGELTGVPEVDAAQALCDASRCVSPTTLVVAADDLLGRGLIQRDDLRAVTPRLTRWLRSVADPKAGSPAESLARLALLRAGYRLRSQVHFDGVGDVDLVVEDAVVVEADGQTYHSDPKSFIVDRQRDRTLNGLGYRVLRFAAAEIFADPEVVTRDVARLVGRGDVHRAAAASTF